MCFCMGVHSWLSSSFGVLNWGYVESLRFEGILHSFPLTQWYTCIHSNSAPSVSLSHTPCSCFPLATLNPSACPSRQDVDQLPWCPQKLKKILSVCVSVNVTTQDAKIERVNLKQYVWALNVKQYLLCWFCSPHLFAFIFHFSALSIWLKVWMPEWFETLMSPWIHARGCIYNFHAVWPSVTKLLRITHLPPLFSVLSVQLYKDLICSKKATLQSRMSKWG